MRIVLIIILIPFTLLANGQSKYLTYTNDQNAYYNKSILKQDTFLTSKINEITLNADSTFEFWSRPNVSCFTWHEYKGTWKKQRDTVLFYDNYEVVENDMMATYKKSNEQKYHISFFTDKNSELNNKEIKIQYVYDFNAHLEDIEKTLYTTTNSMIEIPFQDIPNYNKLAAIRIECLLDNRDKRYGYLTENKILNIRNGALSNVIEVEFIENPKKEIIHRKIKAVLQSNTMQIVETTKNKTTLQDYHEEIIFESSYSLNK